jgi:hypothetical protein
MADKNKITDWEDIPLKSSSDSIDDWQDIPLDASKDENSVSASEAALLGTGQGLTFGLSDELIGAVSAVPSLFTPGESVLDAYKRYRDIERERIKRAEEEQYGAYLGGEIAGGLPTMLIPGLGVAKLAKGASMGKKLFEAAKLGSKIGAAYGAGKSEAELSEGDIGGLTTDVALGAGVGAVGGAAGEALISGTVPLIKGTAGIVDKATDYLPALRIGKENIKAGLKGIKTLANEPFQQQKTDIAKTISKGMVEIPERISNIYKEIRNSLKDQDYKGMSKWLDELSSIENSLKSATDDDSIQALKKIQYKRRIWVY